jgi:hypothetical protein
MVDATIVKVHRHGQAQKEPQSQAIGHSKGGMTTKVLAPTHALGKLVRFVLPPGVAPLIDGLTFEGFIADLNERGAKIVISQHPGRASPQSIDTEIYRWSHLIEDFFCKP